MLEIRFDDSQIKEMERVVGSKRLAKEMSIAVNKTATLVRGSIAKQIGKELNATQKVIKEQLKIKTKASPASLNATVRIQFGKGIPLRDFGARQTKAGVTFKTSKIKGRQISKGAFQGPRPGAVSAAWKGRVFKRVGKSRLPIIQLFGPSPGGVHVYNKHGKQTKNDASEILHKQMKERIRYLTVKALGKIK